MAVPRWQAERGATVRLRVRFEESGVLYDPDAITQVEIIDPASVVIDTLAAGWVHESTGVYYLDWPIPAAATLGLHQDRWTYRPFPGYALRTGVSSFAVFAVGAFTAGDGYMSADELRTEGYVDAASPLTDAQLDYLSRLATVFFENASGRVFREVQTTIDVDGTGRLDLPLPITAPIQSLVSIEDLDGVMTFDVDDFRVRGSRIFHKDWRPKFFAFGDLPPWLRCSDGTIFPVGVMNLRVTAAVGKYTTPPELVKHAVGLMVKAACADDTVTAPWLVNYSSETVDGQSVVYRDTDPGSRKKVSTGIAEVDVIINQFANQTGRIVSLSR